jgi:5-(carboxyamino)imidazole ribonucleotide mutase
MKIKLPVPIFVIMGSKSDLATMKHACEMLNKFDVTYETKIISAHRTPKRLYEFCATAKKNGIRIIIAGAGGAAHLPGMAAAMTEIPVLGVPVESRALKGLDSLLSIAQMPAGIPVACLAIGEAGAKNAALLAIAILALSDTKLAKKLQKFRQQQTYLATKVEIVS